MNRKKSKKGPNDFLVPELGASFPGARISSPLRAGFRVEHFIQSDEKILVENTLENLKKYKNISEAPVFELAGPRETLHWDPALLRVAVVTCGGLAPGLNNVVQNIVTFLYEGYKVRNIFGVPYGFHGFSHNSATKKFEFGWQRLDAYSVQNIDAEAGSMLGTGRGHSDPKHIVDALQEREVQILFAIGGDGTLAGAHAIYEEITRRKLEIGVVGIPKSIDNDVVCVSKTFGFETAVSKAVEVLRSAQTEARSAYHGIGLVKLMGRNSGALTATAVLAMNDIDFALIPEVSLTPQGLEKFLETVVQKVLDKGYVTIACAEGAGQSLFPEVEVTHDASGNVRLKDIGRFLQQKISAEFAKRNIEFTLKYIDPSYILRAQVTTADDSVFCASLAQNAVHAALAGKTGCFVGFEHDKFTHVPLNVVAQSKKQLDVNGSLWRSVLASTGQPLQWAD